MTTRSVVLNTPVAAFVVNEPANDGLCYTGPTFVDSAVFPSFRDDHREFLSPLVPSPAVTLANGGQIPTQGRASAAVRHSRGQLHISKAVHAPGMKRLLSVPQLAMGIDVIFQRGKPYVIHRQPPPTASTILSPTLLRNAGFTNWTSPSSRFRLLLQTRQRTNGTSVSAIPRLLSCGRWLPRAQFMDYPTRYQLARSHARRMP
jgi:hypothetical protein